jgi:hypothetical protein
MTFSVLAELTTFGWCICDDFCLLRHTMAIVALNAFGKLVQRCSSNPLSVPQ